MVIKFNKVEQEIFYVLLKYALERRNLNLNDVKDIQITITKK
jgi:hypothetical protein